jgi:hypothetical protein
MMPFSETWHSANALKTSHPSAPLSFVHDILWDALIREQEDHLQPLPHETFSSA